MRQLVLGFALALAAGAPLHAQGPARPGQPPALPGEIRGTIVDADSKQRIASATVEVWAAADTTLVAGAIARQDGSFRIEGLRFGGYRLRVTMLGYAAANTETLTLAAGAPVANVGAIELSPQAIELEGVEATAERQVTIAPDRNSYAAKEVAPAATSASEVLENVPSVNVDADGKVSLRGNENVVVQINGRPTPIRGAQLAGYLKQLPANTIERVEVIPNPSAKHDPEGMAGIVNIVMKQGVDLGTSGGLTLAASTADRYSIGANVGHQAGPLALFGNYGFYSDEREFLGINDRTRLAPEGSPLSYTEQDMSGTNANSGHNLSLNADYTLNKRDVVYTTMQLNRRSSDEGTLSIYENLSGEREPVSSYDRLRNADSRNWLVDGSLAFKRTMTPQKHELSAEVRFNRQDDTDFTELWRVADGSGRIDVETNDTDGLTHQATAQVDYTRMLGDAVKLETGYKGNTRWLDRDFEVMTDPEGTENWQRSDLSNALEFDETVNAIYGVASRTTGKFDLQAGLRAEHASREFALRDSAASFPHSYNSLFPSGLVNYKADDKTQLKLSYSRRIRRPGREELNPFPVFFDLQNVFIGNPRLNPEYTDALELSYQRSMRLGTLQISPFYRRTNDVIRIDINTADSISGREVTSVSFVNLDHSSSWGADMNGQLRFGGLGNALAAFNVFKMVTDGGSQSALGTDAVTWSARFNATVNVREKTALLLNYFYRAPMKIEGGRFDSFSNANISVRQTLWDDKATLVVRLADPFKQIGFKVRAADDNLIQLTEREFNSRAVFVSLQYRYGQAPRLRQRREDDQPQSSNPFGGQ